MLAPLPVYGQRIVVAPLHWGLGHASRCVPIVEQLLAQGKDVCIASDGDALALLRAEFPHLPYYSLPSYHIRYSYQSMLINMLLGAPAILKAIYSEQRAAARIASTWKADTIISDNRLGFRCKSTHNVYLTHQLQVLGNSQLQSKVATYGHRHYYSKFDECWVPDYHGKSSLAGQLSTGANVSVPLTYLGPLSRMSGIKSTTTSVDCLAILSGPEPQRTTLEKIVLGIAKQHVTKTICIVRGTKGAKPIATTPNVIVHDLLGTDALQALIAESAHIVCRAGYSSIMDLATLQRAATIIPTPGQTEQEYLAGRLSGRYGLMAVSQGDLLSNAHMLYSEGART